MAACRSAIERKTPRRMCCRVILEKKFSTALSQEAKVGVKWNIQLGCRQPSQHLGMFVSGVVVEHRVDQLASRDLARDASRKRMNSQWRWRCMQRPMTVSSSTLSAANRLVVRCRL